MKRIVAATLFAIAAMFMLTVASATGAHVQRPSDQCNTYKKGRAHLEKTYGEVVVYRGLASNGNLIEVLVSPGGKSWSIIVIFPNGRACITASGEDWIDVNKAKPLGFKIKG